MTSEHNSLFGDARNGSHLDARTAFRLTWASLRARYRLRRSAGVVFLAGAVLDPFIYAAIIYLVIAGIFERTGFDRFYFLVLGLISFRWTISCVLDGTNFIALRARFAEVSRHPVAVALIVVTGPPTIIMALSLAVAIGVAHFGAGAGFSLAAWPWVVPVLVEQGLWNLVLVLAVSRVSRWASERLFMVVAGLLWLLSPTLYKFGDIPAAASAIFTTYNPVSHVLAGYHNALWFGLPISLRVLPLAGLLGVVLLIFLSRRRPASPLTAAVDLAALPDSAAPVLVVIDPAGGSGAAHHIVGAPGRPKRPWLRRIKGLTGRDVARFMVQARGADDWAGELSRIVEISKLGRLFDDRISLYPDRALAQLAFAMAIADNHQPLVLDGILDNADRVFVAEAWQRLVEIAGDGRPMVVVTYTLLALPPTAQGGFVALSDGRSIRTGSLDTDLAAFYDQVMADGAFPRDEF